jgi:hypothetical protein
MIGAHRWKVSQRSVPEASLSVAGEILGLNKRLSVMMTLSAVRAIFANRRIIEP